MRKIRILGVPIGVAASRRGSELGPSALRAAGLQEALSALGHEVIDAGDVDLREFEELLAREEIREGEPRYAGALASAMRSVRDTVARLDGDATVVSLGGDHSVSMGTVAGAAQSGSTGVIWVDAHADMNTPHTSPSQNVHGMPLAHLLGHGDERLLQALGDRPVLDPAHVVFIGLREVDPGERELIRRLGVRTFTLRDIDELGMFRVVTETLQHLRDVERLHVSFDTDALEPGIAPGVGTTSPGGLSYREGHLLMELLAESGRVTSLDMVEVNPLLDIRNRTAQTMVGMAASLFGKSIL